LPSRYWQALEDFVRRGGKLVVDGLTAYYDEYAHCIMKTGFPLENLFGASVKEFKLEGELFEVTLTDPSITLPGHCWQGTLRVRFATPIGFLGEEITAVRHAFGDGEVIWIPTLLGLGARLQSTMPLSLFLYTEAQTSISVVAFRFRQHYPGLMMKTMCAGPAYLTIIINKSSQSVEIGLILPDILRETARAEILFGGFPGQTLNPDRINILPEETLVVKWE